MILIELRSEIHRWEDGEPIGALFVRLKQCRGSPEWATAAGVWKPSSGRWLLDPNWVLVGSNYPARLGSGHWPKKEKVLGQIGPPANLEEIN